MKKTHIFIVLVHVLFGASLFAQRINITEVKSPTEIQTRSSSLTRSGTTTNYGTATGTNGSYGSFFGYGAGKVNAALGHSNAFFGANSGLMNLEGNSNVFLGANSGQENTDGNANSFLGRSAGAQNIDGNDNTFLGYTAGFKNRNGSSNVFIGYGAGYNELGSNKLYINSDNRSTNLPLIYGDFALDKVGINTKTIPVDATFAVGGNTNIDGALKAKHGTFEAKDLVAAGNGVNANLNSIALSAGRVVNTYANGFEARLLNFFDFPNSVFFGIEDHKNVSRLRYVAETGKESQFNLYDKNQSAYFTLLESADGAKILQMGKANSKLRINAWGDYLPEHAAVIKGSSMFEGDIFSTQGLGLGTTTLGDYKLAVNGNIHAKGVVIETNWADYVFYKDYKLPTLEEVEKHIQEKGHLINIPSAAEVEANGISLGEINAKLLEKIEELTLYTIAQEKEIKELQEVKVNSTKLEARLTKLETLLVKQ